MPNTLNEQTLDQISAMNAKMLADMAQTPMGISVQNAVAQQQRVNDMANSVMANAMNTAQEFQQIAAQQGLQLSANSAAIQQAMLGRVTRHLLDMSGEQAAAFEKTLGAQLQDQITELNAALASSQQSAKIANTTPPETGIAQQLININSALVAIMEQLRSNRAAP